MTLLNKYSLKRGIEAALVDQDRFMVSLVCFFVSSKANSQFIMSSKLLEFYYFNRPMLEVEESSKSVSPSSGLPGSPSHALAAQRMTTAAHR